MNFKRIFVSLPVATALMVCVPWAHAQGQGETATAATSAQLIPQSGNKGEQVTPPQAAPTSALRLVDKDAPGRDAQGNMRIKVIDGGIKRPTKL